MLHEVWKVLRHPEDPHPVDRRVLFDWFVVDEPAHVKLRVPPAEDLLERKHAGTARTDEKHAFLVRGEYTPVAFDPPHRRDPRFRRRPPPARGLEGSFIIAPGPEEASRSMRVLVTGGAGFIGSHLVDALLARRHDVRVLDDFSTGLTDNLPARPGLTVLRGDIRDLVTCRNAAADREAVFHEAALGSVPRSMADPASTHAVNATGTMNVFIAAREAGVRRVVYASSSSVYGDDATLPKREDRLGEPLSPYAATKRANELDAAAFARCYGLTFVGLRYFNVYGPRQRSDSAYAAVVPLFLKAALAGESAVINGDGEQTRSFTFVEDVAAANLAALDAPLEPGSSLVVNVGSSGHHSVNDLWRAVCRAARVSIAPRHGPPRAGDVRDSLADSGRARTLLRFEPRTALEDGLERTLRAYAAHGGVTPEERGGPRPR